MQALLKAIRASCPSRVWSQGVELARQNRVAAEETSDDEIVLRVHAPGGMPSPTVVLYPADEEWDCDCASRATTCAHICAAIITVSQAHDKGETLPSASSSAAAVAYVLVPTPGGLELQRYLVSPDGERTPLTSTLTSAATAARSVQVSATEADLRVDQLLGVRPRATLPHDRLVRVFRILGASERVMLGDEPVHLSHEPIGPAVIVEDYEDGVQLRYERDPLVDSVVSAGVLRIGDTLHPVGEATTTGMRLERLPRVEHFAREDISRLATQILPDLRNRLSLDIRTRRLPRQFVEEYPRIDLSVEQAGGTLRILPTLVYGDPPIARVDSGKLVHLGGALPVRNEGAEKRVARRFQAEMHLAIGVRRTLEGNDALDFARRLQSWRGSTGVDQTALVMTEELVPQLQLGGDSFDVTFQLPNAEEGRHAAATAVIDAWLEGHDLVPLLGGGYAPLPKDWLDTYGHHISELLTARSEDGVLPTCALPALAALCDQLEHPRPPSFARLAPLIDNFDGIPSASLPTDLTAELRPYQRAGFNWLRFVEQTGLGAVLADDMGLGKTLQALCVIGTRALVVCPRSLIHNWAAEIERFRPSLTTSVYHGAKRQLDDADVTLTTYAVLRLDIETLSAATWDTVILDEAQAIKNPDSQVAQAAYRLPAAFRITLSGTPIENRLEELWSALHFTNPGLLGGRKQFDSRYARPIAANSPGAAQTLHRKIKPFVLRRTKAQVAPELPPRTDAVLHCELTQEERDVYNSVLAATREDVAAQLGGGVMAMLEALLRLRQASCHLGLLGHNSDTSAKTDALLEALCLSVAENHKALVFSQWTSFLDLIEPHLQREGLGFVRLDGSTRDRAKVVSDFQSAQGPPVMLASLKAGGTGLNLTAADHVFLCDPWWNPAAEDQAADRAHRIGQTKPVFIYRLVAKDTVEERILSLQSHKRKLAEAALLGTGGVFGLTREDLISLLV